MARRLLFFLLAIPGLVQLALLAYAVTHRIAYPYDLEWMEGGMLAHAQRMLDGHSIYSPPSVDFIPYLYTPLYPAVLAALGKVMELSYFVGRAVSVAATLTTMGLAVWALERGVPRRDRPLALVGAVLGLGIFAACYPWFEGWYDVVRGDMLFLAIGTGGLVALESWARKKTTGFWHPHVAVAAALLALSFFAKQTGVLLVFAGGAALLVMNWRAVPMFVVVAGAIGGGGSVVLDKLTGGWFWIYVFKVHQQHDTNIDRFWKSFANIFGHFPALTIAVAATLLLCAFRFRSLPASAHRFLYWAWMFACGAVIGALGWATQWAHFNAYIPAMTFGAIAAGAAVRALPDLAGEPFDIPAIAAVTLALGTQLCLAGWSPRPLIPRTADRLAGDRLIERLYALPGDVFIPSHPWYAHLAGKPLYTHRIGIMDVTTPPAPGHPALPPRAREVEGLEAALRGARFSAVIVDDRQPEWELPGLTSGYRPDVTLGAAESPHVVTGALTVPRTVWVPIDTDANVPGTRVLFDFEAPTFAATGWETTGTAWGKGPVNGVPNRDVIGFRGRRFASSFNGGDAPTGTLLSPPFVVEGKQLVFRLAGGNDAKHERAELRLDGDDPDAGQVVRTATGARSLTMNPVVWDIADLAGKTVRLVFIDDGSAPWDGLVVDDVREVDSE